MGPQSKWQRHRAASAARAAAASAIAADARFREGVERIAKEQGADPADYTAKAAHYLDEMVTANNEALPDFSLILSKIADSRNFEGVLSYDAAALDRIHTLDGDQSLVITTAHRSYLDFLVRVPFAERGFPREYRFAGANINFWPMGSIAHSFGISFVRRGMRDPLYTFVLRRFVGWMTHQRANFMWAIEGGRTRTGKLLRPKVGLLAYVAEAFVEDPSAGVMMVPTTIVYEYLNEVHEYAKYGRGAEKTSEGVSMFYNFAVAQRRVPKDAKIFVGIGDPVSLGDFLARDCTPEEFSAGITRAALEVSRRVDAATPFTAVALVLLPLLERGGVTLTVEQIRTRLAPIHEYIARRGLPAPGAAARDVVDVRRALDLLTHQGLLAKTVAAGNTTYTVAADKHLEAAYYRNSIVHHFLIPSVIELGLVRAAAEPSERGEAFHREVERLRELLDGEFFFPEGDNFWSAVQDELSARDGDWTATLAGPDGAHALLDRMRPVVAPQTIGPFLEAHGVIADGLHDLGFEAVADRHAFRLERLASAQHDVASGRLVRPDVASLNMFDTPLTLARSRDLLDEGQVAGRSDFAKTVQDFVDALHALESDAAQPDAAQSAAAVEGTPGA